MNDSASTILELSDVVRTFSVSRGIFKKKTKLHAVSGVSLSVQKGQVWGLVGESGCGKSTLAMMILGLLPATSGRITVNEKALHQWHQRNLSRLIQPVFQDPYSSLNPRKTIGQIVGLPLRVHEIGSKEDQCKKVKEMLEMVGLSPRAYDSYPNQLSGGQRQRVAVARALIMRPQIVLCDEPTSALDVSVQSQILNLLIDFRQKLDLTYLLISHNLAVVEHMATHIAVMYLGRIVEMADTDSLFANPRHPYTRALLKSVLLPEPGKRVTDPNLGLEFPNPFDLPTGCKFHPRCSEAMPVCRITAPDAATSPGGYVECHLYSETSTQDRNIDHSKEIA
ncbi:MAG: ATP-binding cassette domain-containing protein [Desulfuromonadales bacterium]|nr:ATP-binding cassette domain-containing protein [Desulfuromonadales bacterium]